MRKSLVSGFIILISCTGWVHLNAEPLPSIPWIENAGQFEEAVRFKASIFSGNIFATREGTLSYQLSTETGKTVQLDECFNASAPVCFMGADKAVTRMNYFLGDPSTHRTDISTFHAIETGEVWPGITIHAKADSRNVEKIFELQPGSDPNAISIALSGITDICITDKQELQLDIGEESVFFTAPLAWQLIDKQQVPIRVSYRIDNTENPFLYGFDLPEYNADYPVIIDPLLASTYFGGSGSEEVKKVLVDAQNRVYVIGKTKSMDLPVTPNAYDQSYNAATTEYDAYVARLSPDLDVLEACTYIGGNDDDHTLNGAIDGNGNVFICGYTYSKNFPSTPGAWNPNHLGKNDYNRNAFISKLNPDLSVLSASTFISDESGSTASAIVVDHLNKVIIAGTSSNGIPKVGPQFFSDCEGTVLIKFNNNLTTAEATNSLGDDGGGLGPSALVIDHNGDVIGTNSLLFDFHDFVTTIGCYQSQKAGGDEAYIFKMNSSLSGLRGATYYGGFHDDNSYGLGIDQSNNIYICGTTKSSDLPVAPGAFDTTGPEVINNNLKSDAFVAKFNPTLTSLQAATFLGIENYDDYSYSMTLDVMDQVLVFSKMGAGMPTACNSFQIEGPGCYIASFDPTLQEVVSSTYIRGYSGLDRAESLALDQNGNVLVSGRTSSSDFPVLNGYDETANGSNDLFISKFTPDMKHGLPCCTWLNDPGLDQMDVLPHTLLSWNAAYDATGYYLTVGTEDDRAGILDQIDLGDVLNYDINKLPCDEKIYVQVDAYNENGIAQGQDCFTSSFYTAKPVLTEFFDTICEGDILYWEGFPLYYEGRFRVLYDAHYGCDSILQMNLMVIPSFYEMQAEAICEGDSILWFGNYYAEPGNYMQSYTSVTGCDSIYELDLTLLDASLTEIHQTICEGDSYAWEGMELTEAGSYSVGYQTTEGCDSIIRLILETAPTFSFFDVQELCESSSLDWHGQSITAAGTYFAGYTTQMGCDSNYVLEVIVHPEYEFFENQLICSGESLTWQGMVYSASGNYSASFETVYGCDSTYYLTLEVAPGYRMEEQLNLCPDESISWQGMELAMPGTYEATYQSSFGCDSTYVLILTAVYIDKTVTVEGDTFHAVDQEGALYQWLTCPDMIPINGAVDPVYMATESGSYAVQIVVADCPVVSECIDLIHSNTGLLDPVSCRIYPNPSLDGQLRVELSQVKSGYVLRLFDLEGTLIWDGRLTQRVNTLSIGTLPAGLYLAVIVTGEETHSFKLIIL